MGHLGMGPLGMGAGGGEADISALAARIFALSQPREEPTAASFIASLPEATIGDAEVASKQQCSVCLADFEKGEKGVCKVPCGHLFHKDECLLPWLKAHNNCPVCRAEFESQAAETAKAQEGAASSQGGGGGGGGGGPRARHPSSRSAPALGRRTIAPSAPPAHHLNPHQLLAQLFGGMPLGGGGGGYPGGHHAVGEDGFDESEIEAAMRASLAEAEGGDGDSLPELVEDRDGLPELLTVLEEEGGGGGGGGGAGMEVEGEDEGFRAALGESFRDMTQEDLHRSMEAEGLTLPLRRVDDRVALVEVLTRNAIAQGSGRGGSAAGAGVPLAAQITPQQLAQVGGAGASVELKVCLEQASQGGARGRFTPAATLRTALLTLAPAQAASTGRRGKWARAAASGFEGCWMRSAASGPSQRYPPSQWDKTLADLGIGNLSSLILEL